MFATNAFEDDTDMAALCQSKELLSLRWNNHLLAFRTLLSSVKEKSCFSDVTVACSGELFAVHKLVLSSCSEYFSAILRATLCPQPVIVLKDISCKDFHALLNYMYLGEVNILREELSSFLNASESLGIKGLSMSDEGNESNSSYERTTETHSTDSDTTDKLLKLCQENENVQLQTCQQTSGGNTDDSNTDNNDSSVYSDSNCAVLSRNSEVKQKRKVFESEASVSNSVNFDNDMNYGEELDSSKKIKLSSENNSSNHDSENTMEECTLNEHIEEFYEDDTFDIMPQVCVNIKEEPEPLLCDKPAPPVVSGTGQLCPTTEQLPLAEGEATVSAPHKQQYVNRTMALAEIITEALDGGDRDTDTGHYLGSLECEDLSVVSKDKSGDSDVCLLQLEPRPLLKQPPDAHHQHVQHQQPLATHPQRLQIDHHQIPQVAHHQPVQVAAQQQVPCHQEQRVPPDLKSRPNLTYITDNVKNVKTKSGFIVKQSCSGVPIASKPIVVGECGGPLSEVSGVSNVNCGGMLAGEMQPGVMYVPAGTVTFSQQPSIVCRYCAKEFAFASDLRRHMRSHTGEKPFQCPLCSFKTSQRYNLERHKKIHGTKV